MLQHTMAFSSLRLLVLSIGHTLQTCNVDKALSSVTTPVFDESQCEGGLKYGGSRHLHGHTLQSCSVDKALSSVTTPAFDESQCEGGLRYGSRQLHGHTLRTCSVDKALSSVTTPVFDESQCEGVRGDEDTAADNCVLLSQAAAAVSRAHTLDLHLQTQSSAGYRTLIEAERL